MPKGTPDEGVYRPEVNAQDVLPRKIIPELSGDSIYGTTGRIADNLSEKIKADTATAAGNQLADFHLSMMQQMESAKQSAAPGAQGYTKTILDQFDTQAKALTSGNGPNGLALKALTPGLRTLRAQFGEQAIAYEAAQGIDYRLSSIKDNADKLSVIAGKQPEQFGSLMGQVLAQANTSRLPPNVTLEAAHYAQSTLAKAAVLSRAQTDPYETLKALMKPDPADAAVMALKPEERDAAMQHADSMLHQRVSDAERIDSIHEKAERQASSAALTSLIVKSQSPEGLTIADVMSKAPLFRHEPGALESALGLVGGKNVVSNPAVYADLLHRAMGGQDVYTDAIQHFGRDLDKSDFTKLVEMGDKGVPNALKQGEDFINNAMRPGVMDKYNPAVNLSHASALDAYFTWQRSSPNATPDQAVAQAKSLVSSYSLVDLSKSRSALPMEPWIVGGRTGMDPDASALAVAQAETTHQIDHQEAIRRMSLVSQWRAALDRAKAAQAAAAKVQ